MPTAGAFNVIVAMEFVVLPTTLVGFRVSSATDGKCTTSEKFCTAFGETPLLAMKVMEYVPAVPAAGVPLSTPVEGLKVMPAGRAPLSDNVGEGIPVAMTLNEPAKPTVNALVLALLIAGG